MHPAPRAASSTPPAVAALAHPAPLPAGRSQQHWQALSPHWQMIVVRHALRSAAARCSGRRRVVLHQHNVPVVGGLGMGAGLAAALFSGGSGGGSHADGRAQTTRWVQAWLPSPASLVGEPTVSCAAAAAATTDGQGWQDDFDSWARELMAACGERGLIPRQTSSGAGTSDGHWTAEWHLMRGRLWGEGALEKLRVWRPAEHMIDGDVLCLVRLGGQVCGHRAFVHGGFTAALFDELFGASRARRMRLRKPRNHASPLGAVWLSEVAAKQSNSEDTAWLNVPRLPVWHAES